MYCTVSLIFLSPLFSYDHIGSAIYPGDPRLNAWILAWANRFMSGHVSSLFDSNIFFPATGTLAYSEHLFGIALFSLPFNLLTHNPILSYNVIWWISYPLTASSVHSMGRSFLTSDVSCVFFSTLFTFGFFRMLHGHGHLQLLWVFWLPLGLLATDSWFKEPSLKTTIALTICLVMQILSSWYLGVFAILAVALSLTVHGVVELLHNGTEARSTLIAARIRHLIAYLVPACAISALVILPFARPYYGVLETVPDEPHRFAARLLDYVTVPSDTWVGMILQRAGYRSLPWSFGETTVFQGFITLALAAIGLYSVAVRGSTRARQAASFLLLLSTTACLLSLGPRSPRSAWPLWPFDVFASMPGMQFFRTPARFAMLVSFGLAGLAGLGAESVARMIGPRKRWALFALLALGLSESYLWRFPLGHPERQAIPRIYAYLAKLKPGPAVSLPSHRGTDQWWREADYQLYSTIHWYPIVNGYSRSEPPDHYWITGHMMAFPGPNSARTMRRLGVRYVIVHSDRYPDRGAAVLEEAAHTEDYRMLLQDDGIFLFEVTPGRATP
ncbi:MAG: hypothetical protein U0Q12_07225 [Vicinamibacterales bacterium]